MAGVSRTLIFLLAASLLLQSCATVEEITAELFIPEEIQKIGVLKKTFENIHEVERYRNGTSRIPPARREKSTWQVDFKRGIVIEKSKGREIEAKLNELSVVPKEGGAFDIVSTTDDGTGYLFRIQPAKDTFLLRNVRINFGHESGDITGLTYR